MSHTAPHSTASGSNTPLTTSLPASSSDPTLVPAATPSDPPYTYAAPPLPSSIRASLQAWWRARPTEDAAHAELHLYRSSGYLAGASVANVAADTGPLGDGKGLARALERVRESQLQNGAPATATSQQGPEASRLAWLWRKREEDRVTIATKEADDGKVGAIRLVDLGPASLGAAQQAEAGASAGAGLTLSRLKERMVDTASSVTHKQHPSRSGSADEFLSDNPATDAPEALVNGGGYTPPAGRKINMLEIGLPYTSANAAAIEAETKVVLLHGYGAGTAFFYQNIGSLASLPSTRLYALDWLGMGRSSRPSFHIPAASLKTTESRVTAAESFFVDSLEEWRRKMGLEKMVLIGHSLGGYLSTAYALRYPTRVERLVRVSPVGIPHAPVEVEAKEEKGIKRVEEEVKKPQRNIAPQGEDEAKVSAEVVGGSAASPSTAAVGTSRPSQLSRSDTADSGTVPRKGQTTAPEKSTHEPPRFSKTSRSVFAYLWEQNFSPFDILRSSFVFGPYMASKYTSRRFGALPREELETLHSYCQAIFLSKGSGEYCLAHLLKPGAYARLPMVDRIGELRGRIAVTFMYGEHDWMDVAGGRKCVKILNRDLTEGSKGRARCFVVPKSGHHIYLDNKVAFDTLIRQVLQR